MPVKGLRIELYELRENGHPMYLPGFYLVTFLYPTRLASDARWRAGVRLTLGPLSLSLADLGGVCEGVLHTLPDVLRNFDTVAARP